jgi:MinD-like ATPase involved in chromosome partitioning or flagellar assembly
LTNSQDTSASTRVLLAVGNPARERELRDALAEQGLLVAGRFLDGPSLVERAQSFDAEVALASSDLHRLSQASLVAIREARLPLVLLAEPADFEAYAGLAHCLSRNAPAVEVAAAVRQAVARGVTYAAASGLDSARAALAVGGDGEGRVLVLAGGKGAPGVTTLAIGLAAALAEKGRRVVLVDADLRGGNVVPYLDLDPSRGLLSLGVGRHGGSGALPVEEELQDGPGFLVLAGIERPETYRGVSAELAAAAVSQLQALFDEVVVDAGEVIPGISGGVADALARSADQVLVVSGADLVAAWNAQCCIRYLREEVGLPPESLAVLLNRSAGRGGYGAREVEQALDAPVLAVVPDDRRAARRAVTQQLPLSAVGGRAARRLRSLAKQLTEQAQPAPQERKRRRWPLRPRLMPIGRR